MTLHINCIILDDEENNIKVLKKILQKYCPHVSVIAEEKDSLAGLELIKKLNPDLIFLDIEMPELNGFELLKKLEPVTFEVIFVTGFSDYAIKAFDFNAVGYVTKPIDEEKLIIAIQHAQQRIEQKNTSETIFSLLESRMNSFRQVKIPLGTLHGMIFVNEESIIYCESNGSYTNFYTIEGKKLIVSKPIGEYEKMLPMGNFVRIHDKYIINLKFVTEYIKGRGGELKLNNNISLPVSVKRKEILMTRFDEWMKRD